MAGSSSGGQGPVLLALALLLLGLFKKGLPPLSDLCLGKRHGAGKKTPESLHVLIGKIVERHAFPSFFFWCFFFNLEFKVCLK
jgi:hypothetical protein